MSKKKALSFSKFIKRFPNEEACVKYLYAVKWSKGFVCPVCGYRHCYALSGYGRYQCANCRHQTSLTANTTSEIVSTVVFTLVRASAFAIKEIFTEVPRNLISNEYSVDYFLLL